VSSERVDLAGAEARRLLERGDLEVLGLLPRSTNATFLARIRDADREHLVVYKPRDGESPLWDFPEGTLCRREVAAYLVAETLGWPRIPPTILREGPLGLGMVQLFVELDPAEHYFTLRDEDPNAFRRIAVFDAVVNNADRKAGHCLRSPSGEIVCIDHGLCFHGEPKLRTVIWDYMGEPIEPEILRDLERLSEDMRGSLGPALEPLLRPGERAALSERVEDLLRSGRYPEPGPGRPVPWPPV
jgi:Phosphatidylinositol 3- and 4-kinase